MGDFSDSGTTRLLPKRIIFHPTPSLAPPNSTFEISTAKINHLVEFGAGARRAEAVIVKGIMKK